MAVDLIDQLTQDPDFLSLSEQDQDAMYEELSGKRPNETTSTPATSFLSRIGNVLNPFPAERQYVGNRLASDVQSVKDVVGATPTGQLLRAGTAPPLRVAADFMTSPPVVSSAIRESLNPWNVLMGEVAPKATAGTVKAATATVKDVAQLGRPSTIMKPSPFREVLVSRVQNRLLQAPKLAGQEFEEGLNQVVKLNPSQTVDLSGSLQTYLNQANKNPAFKTLIERQALNHQESGLVQLLLNQPELASQLTLQDSQTVKQIFQRAIKSKFKDVSPEFFGAHLDALEVWHDIRAAQLSAFPQFKKVLKGYATTLANFRVVKNILKEGALEPKLLNNLSNNSQLITAFRELATPDTLRMVMRLQKSDVMRKFLIRLGIGAAGLIGAGYFAKKIGVPLIQH